MTYLTMRCAAAMFTVMFGVVGCGSDDGSSGASAGDPTGALEAAEAQRPQGVSQVDACSLLSVEDISALLGTTVDGKSTGAGCIWENQANYESVTVEIGEPNSAVDNTLPPPEPGFPEVGTPGPDGMRFLGSGSVEFAAGTRSNMVQVAVLRMSTDEANAAAVELARKIGPQLPA
jgi:hypothetical protein